MTVYVPVLEAEHVLPEQEPPAGLLEKFVPAVTSPLLLPY